MKTLGTHVLFAALALLWVFPANATAPINHDDDVEVEGLIEELGDQTVTVAGYTFLVTGETEMEGPDGEDWTFSDLELGMFVEAEGEYQGETLVAEEIEVEETGGGEVEVEGLITALGDSTLTVGGFEFLVTPFTEIEGEHGSTLEFEDLSVGDFAEVEGHFAGEDLLADEIEIDSDGNGEIEVEGPIESLTESSLTVQGQEFLVDGSTEIRGPHGSVLAFEDLVIGQFVEVEGHFASDGSLIADRIEVEIEDDEDVEVEGAIEELGSDFLVVSGISFLVDASTIVLDDNGNTITFEDLQLGMFVEVHGRFVGGELIATRIKVEDNQIEDEVRVKAALDAVEADAVVILGQVFLVTESTVILDLNNSPITLGDLSAGQVVELEANRRPDGSLVAFRIEREDTPPDLVELRALVDGVGTSSITVLSVTFLVDGSTVILDRDNNPISLGDIGVGDYVDVNATFQGAELLATRIEVRRRAAVVGTIGSISGNQIGLPGVSASISNATIIHDAEGRLLGIEALSAGLDARILGQTAASGVVEATRILVANASPTAAEPGGSLPDSFTLSPVYPNPFNPQARFTLELAESQLVRVSIYDVLGREVATLHNGQLSVGPTTFEIDGSRLTSGQYVVRAQGDATVVTRTFTLLR